ncbi:GATA transcription factor 9-like [Andrographis paniculata]|uniref:GATA transcription factor 9-like n=1 Tax=Andrographis paniculata TaxID=175694 RepID=UPI0021E790CB|nr:GATA transcription factor 9-like [Andrographis paniculata]
MEYFSGEFSEFSSLEDDGFSGGCNYSNAVHFAVDDLLDFPKEEETMIESFLDGFQGNSGDSSTATAVDSCNSSVSGGGDGGQSNGNVSRRSFDESQFSGNELCVPYDDLAELEWLSNFVEKSFSTADLHFIPAPNSAGSGAGAASSSVISTHSPHPPPKFPSDVSVPGKARSKRSRAAPCDWSSRLLLLSLKEKKKEPSESPGRKCLHCSSEKTPQWRTGPLGPKTLCNACGVRFKSGRLVAEYRPAASPTFVSAKHSNSHRKVLELRRQKELQQQPQHLLINQASIFNGFDDFLIHHRTNINGPDLRHMI